jgi:hypothetical protein
MVTTLTFLPRLVADQRWDRDHLTALLSAIDDLGYTPKEAQQVAVELLMQVEKES